MKNYPPLYGKIVTLARPKRQDYVVLGQIFHDPKNMAQVDVYNNPTPEELEQIWQMHNTAINEQKAVRYTINHNADKKIVGCCGFNAVNVEKRSANYGIILDHHYWHSGIHEECAVLSYDFGFDKLGLDVIEITTRKGRGVKYLKKFGFVLQEIRESVQIGGNTYYNACTYSIDKKQWSYQKTIHSEYLQLH
jgi:[ribosomal protein S5]-alanine N-acetyltransferase